MSDQEREPTAQDDPKTTTEPKDEERAQATGFDSSPAEETKDAAPEVRVEPNDAPDADRPDPSHEDDAPTRTLPESGAAIEKASDSSPPSAEPTRPTPTETSSELPALPEEETREPHGGEAASKLEGRDEPARGESSGEESSREEEKTAERGAVHIRRRKKSSYASEIKPGQDVEGVFMALRKSLPLDKTGRRFLALTLADRTGRIESRLWNGAEKAAEAFQESDHVKVRGKAQSYHGRLQLHLDFVEPVDIAALDLPASEFISESQKPVDKMFSELLSILGKMENEGLKALVRSFLDDPRLLQPFKRAPAAQSIHHAWIGGLLEHTLSVVRLCERLCDHYPQVDRDLVRAGAILHDFGKIEELTYDETLGYTDAGRLVGHLVICCQMIHEKARAVSSLPKAVVDQLVHIVASHHGQFEYGSIRQPQTLEALLVHSADVLDARMASWMELLESVGPDGWTDFSRIYDRQLYRGSQDSTAPASHGARKKRRRRRKGKGEQESASEKDPAKTEARPTRKDQARAKDTPAFRQETSKGGRRQRGPTNQIGDKQSQRRPRPKKEARGPKDSSGPKPREKKPTLTFNPFAGLKDRVEDSPAPATEGETRGTEIKGSEPMAQKDRSLGTEKPGEPKTTDTVQAQEGGQPAPSSSGGTEMPSSVASSAPESSDQNG